MTIRKAAATLEEGGERRKHCWDKRKKRAAKEKW